MKEKELVCYVLVHSHLSPIQKGVQAAHAVAMMVADQRKEVIEWEKDFRTIIMLDAGNSKSLLEWVGYFHESEELYGYFFREDEETLDRLITAGAFVIDKNELKTKKKYRELYNKLSGLPLAR